mgnify:CR=1 FL=1
MPIHLIWGDDYEACNREIEEIIQTVINPSWKSFNYSQIDGNDPKQNFRALEEVQSAPFGSGGRIVLVRRSPFCNGCSIELANKLEQAIKLIPNNTYLILNNSNNASSLDLALSNWSVFLIYDPISMLSTFKMSNLLVLCSSMNFKRSSSKIF